MKIQRCNSRSFSNSKNGEEKISESIPFDLVIEIFMRLPSKSVARFRCVSKLCDSTLIKPDFIESYNAISSSRPKILFTCLKDGETFFFLSSKPQDSSSLTASIHMSFPINRPFEICRPVLGLVCGLNQQTLKGRIVTFPWICNPSTGKSLTLPRLKTRRREVTSYLGYDPIDKQFKLLCMTHAHGHGSSVTTEFEILTLGTGKEPSWRRILCNIVLERVVVDRKFSHIVHERVVVDRKFSHTKYDGICINGVLYYLAYVWGGGGYPSIVCFEFRYETFKCIKNDHGMRKSAHLSSTLVNYKGKLALLQPNIVNNIYNGYQLWVLENAENQQWLNYVYVWAPRPPQKKVVEEALFFVGTSDTGDIVLSPKIISDSFYLIYYNPERSTFTRVGIQGMEAFKGHIAYTFLDHVEDLKQVSTIIGS